MTDPRRVAVIGLGHQAGEDHLPAIVACERVELVAVCDADRSVADAHAGRLAVPAYTDHGKLLEEITPDFVVVCTPHDTHRQIVEDAVRRSIHVMKEKPFAMNVSDARALVEASEQTGATIMTTLQRRFNPIYTSYFQLAEEIGTPFLVDVAYTIYVEDPHTGWRGRRRRAGGGCLIDMGYHMIDLLIWYLGMPSGVIALNSSQAVAGATYDAEDTSLLLIQWPSGISGSLRISRSIAPKSESLRVVGTKGIVEIQRGVIRRLDAAGELCEELRREDAWPVAATTQLRRFCDVLDGVRQQMGGPAFHLQHLAVVEAAYRSAETKTLIDPRGLLDAFSH